MLPFMKEQNSGPDDAGKSPEEQVNSSGIKDFQNEDFITVSSQGSSVKKSTTALGVLFVIGLAALFLMIKKSSPGPAMADAATEDAKLQSAISRITGVSSEMVTKMDEVVQKFNEFSNFEQVEVDELVKDPFRHDIVPGGLADVIDGGNLDIDAANAKQLAELELYSIMGSGKAGDKFCCMINDKLLNEGDEISGFTVVKITESSVKLKLDDNEFTLKLEK